jgi:two-component system response regulator AtoC
MREVMTLVEQWLLARRRSSSSARAVPQELVAKALHENSPRKAKAFVKLHCAALPENLLESELFGYEKGAFTGAVARKPGRVELANEGTLFLDEIGDVPLSMQVKLLRMLQEREFERVGGTETIKVDVRFVAATHRDLEAMVKSGAFREDLFYRLSVVPLFIPPLRARQDDIEPLVRHFATVHAAANRKPGL